MTKKENVEIYNQRYETFRHLDRLRWQMLQIGIAAGSILIAFSDDSGGKIVWWALLTVGIVLLSSSVAMMRIGSGIKANAEVLRAAGLAIGDEGIKVAKSQWRGVAFWVALFMMIAGGICVITAISLYLPSQRG